MDTVVSMEFTLVCIVGCIGASQLGGSLLGIPPGYKAYIGLQYSEVVLGHTHICCNVNSCHFQSNSM